MGQGDANGGAEGHDRNSATTLLILVVLRRAHPRALSTYEIGLAVTDNHNRPLSILIKTLAKDRYIERAASAGKRAGYWTITERGFSSLARRQDAVRTAEEWLDAHPNYTPAERAVLGALDKAPLPAARLVAATGLLHSPVRTALKRLALRHHLVQPIPPDSEYRLTPKGRSAARTFAS